ncbi:MAG: WD40 repeat domain-containing protein [Cyanobacteriota bacterium]|nr:WD40 repeat domain-containing protein [Cyanobacteriota bacterium]
MSNSNRLEATEYLCWAISAAGSAMAAVSGQLLYATVPLCCSLLLNLVNRRRLNDWRQRQMMGAIVRVHQQVSQDLQLLERQVRGVPASVAPETNSSTPLISPVEATPSKARLSQLDDLQLVYQEIVQLQEQYASLRDSLAGAIDYLNNAHLATKMSVLEQEIDRLYSHLRLIQQQIDSGHSLEPHTDSISPTGESATLTSDLETPIQILSSQWVGEYEPMVAAYSPAPAPSFTLHAKKEVLHSEPAAEATDSCQSSSTAIVLPSFHNEPSPDTDLESEPTTESGGLLPQTPLNSTPTWECVATLTDHSDWVSDLAISPDSQTLIGSSFDKTLQLWNLENHEAIAILAEHTSPAIAMALAPDGTLLASGSWDKTIKLWDLEKQKSIATLTDDSETAGSVRSLVISPNGQILASGWFDQTIKLWKLKAGGKRKRASATFLGSYTKHSGRVDAIAFSPDGKLLASGSADGAIELWQINTTGKPLQDLTRTFAETSEPVTDIAFSPDGKLLASGSRDRTIRVWDVASQELVYQLAGHSGAVMAVAFYPDGEVLASASTDGTIGLWQLGNGQLLETLSGEAGALMSVAIDPQGQKIIGGSAEGIIKVWQRIETPD